MVTSTAPLGGPKSGVNQLWPPPATVRRRTSLRSAQPDQAVVVTRPSTVDVRFLERVIADVAARRPVDQSRVYAIGCLLYTSDAADE